MKQRAWVNRVNHVRATPSAPPREEPSALHPEAHLTHPRELFLERLPKGAPRVLVAEGGEGGAEGGGVLGGEEGEAQREGRGELRAQRQQERGVGGEGSEGGARVSISIPCIQAL